MHLKLAIASLSQEVQVNSFKCSFVKKKTSKRFNGRIFSGIAYNGSLARDGKLIITDSGIS